MSEGKLKKILPKQMAGVEIDTSEIRFVKPRHFQIINVYFDGSAPKETIRMYSYEKGVSYIDRKWPVYIVKTGHKNYPIESITEHLFTDIGKCLGMQMAETFLGIFSGQLKIGSKYFLKSKMNLIKGVQIYSEELGDDDNKYMDEIEEKKMSRELITVNFTYQSLEKKYPNNYQSIFKEYIKLLIFDALTGNNDRHFYNWGVVEKVKRIQNQSKSKKCFSPIYDTARGLFWNTSEKELEKYQKEEQMEKYILNCFAKTSYQGNKKENHFDLIKNIYQNKENFKIESSLFNDIINCTKLEAIIKKLEEDYYQKLLSALRLKLIKECLKKRYSKIKEILN